MIDRGSTQRADSSADSGGLAGCSCHSLNNQAQPSGFSRGAADSARKCKASEQCAEQHQVAYNVQGTERVHAMLPAMLRDMHADAQLQS